MAHTNGEVGLPHRVVPSRAVLLDSESGGSYNPSACSLTANTTQSVSHGARANAVATTRQEVDDDSATLEARIATMNLHNSCTAIAQLPWELMQEIFVITSRSAGYRKVGKTALSVTWVCHTWREVAHGTSALWDHIDFSNPAWVEMALFHTQTRPLYLSFTFEWEEYEDANRLFSVCLEQLARIKTFSVTRANPAGNELNVCLNPLWTTSAPLLVELALYSRTIPRSLSPEIFPSLEGLSLVNCKFEWESLPIRTGLRTLVIDHPRSRTSAEYLLGRLSIIAPTLEWLTLNGTLLKTIAAPRANLLGRLPLKLNKIRHFEMRDDFSPPITLILDHILLPSHVDTIELHLRSGRINQFEMLRALVSCRGLENWPGDAVEFDLQYDTLLLYMVDSDRRSISLSLEKPTIDPRCVQPVFDILPPFRMKTLTLSGNSLDNHVTTLLANFDAPGTTERIEVVQAFIPKFTTIIYNQNRRIRKVLGCKNITDFGNTIDSEMRARCRSIITFHKLTTLEYYGDFNADISGLTMDPVDYEESVEGELNPWWCSTVLSDENGRLSRMYFGILGEWLKWRQLVGLEVGKLIFNDMNVPSRKYLEGLCKGVQVECIDTVHVTDNKEKMKVLTFKANPRA
ncbi:hypothetical protein BDN72DRAFT_962936 [Pluteus cervinus]|uniref:Uncharacterized protein n=1 Tax=Pluteus cervinus TaxID=181527 RepID=A0ACD3AHL2_9AGAR|nr:hypothetical protein BDN72DRAFT_962936 [Pluteus cervinus]